MSKQFWDAIIHSAPISSAQLPALGSIQPDIISFNMHALLFELEHYPVEY